MSSFGGWGNVPSYGQIGGVMPGAGDEFGPEKELTQQSRSSQRSRTFFSDPELASRLSDLLGGVAQGAGQDYLSFIRDPTSSPYFQNAYQGVLAALAPQAEQARGNLSDQFRAAGGLRGGAYGQEGAALESNIYGQQLSGLTNLLTTMFPQVTSALFAPISEIDSLLEALKLQESKSKSVSEAWGWPPQQMTGGGGGGGRVSIGGGTGISSLQPGGFRPGDVSPRLMY